jgi:peptide/nickel transport system substrate-binding protein
MDRRTFLQRVGSAGVLAAGLPAPAIAQPAASRTLRLVPHADLANFDPTWSSVYIARNAGLLVWDMLYGVDAKLRPQRQMVESEDVSPDGLTWTFRLRPGLRFHDGEPVLAKDAVASINRWAVREPMGAKIKAIENELVAIADRTFRWSLRKPYPKMLSALGKIVTPCCFVMPEPAPGKCGTGARSPRRPQARTDAGDAAASQGAERRRGRAINSASQNALSSRAADPQLRYDPC